MQLRRQHRNYYSLSSLLSQLFKWKNYNWIRTHNHWLSYEYLTVLNIWLCLTVAISWPVWLNGLVVVLCVVLNSNLVAVNKASYIAPVSSKVFLDIQATTEQRFTLKRACDMIITCSQLERITHLNSLQMLKKMSW